MVKRLATVNWISNNTLHIETELGIINIRLGLTNAEGQKVESIEVLADQYADQPLSRVEGKNKAGYLRIIQDKKP